MCGISAIVALTDPVQGGHRATGNNKGDDNDALTREMENSLQLIKHRGPDSSGIWINPDQRIGTTPSCWF